MLGKVVIVLVMFWPVVLWLPLGAMATAAGADHCVTAAGADDCTTTHGHVTAASTDGLAAAAAAANGGAVEGHARPRHGYSAETDAADPTCHGGWLVGWQMCELIGG